MDGLAIRKGHHSDIGLQARNISPISHTTVFLALLSERSGQDVPDLDGIDPPAIGPSHHVQGEVLRSPKGRRRKPRAIIVTAVHSDAFNNSIGQQILSANRWLIRQREAGGGEQDQFGAISMIPGK
jgi:hypothetical protein